MENVNIPNFLGLEKFKQFIPNKKEQLIIIEVRSTEEYNTLNIPDAINIEFLNLELTAKLFQKSSSFITVFGKGGGRSIQSAEKLIELGFKNTNWLCGGTFGWFEK